MLINSKQLIKIVESLQQFWKPDIFDNETQEMIRKLLRKVTLLCASYSLSGVGVCILIATMPLLSIQERSLIYNDFTFCNLQSLFCWIPMYIWQFYALMLEMIPACLGFDCLFVSFIGYIMTTCSLIKIALQKLNTDDLQKRHYILKEIVKQHDFMMTFLNSVNDMFTIVMLLQFWGSLWSMILMLNMMVANG